MLLPHPKKYQELKLSGSIAQIQALVEGQQAYLMYYSIHVSNQNCWKTEFNICQYVGIRK